MLEQVDHELVSWIETVLPEKVAVSLEPPAPTPEPPKQKRVGAYLYAFAPIARSTDPQRFLQVQARYLMTAWAATAREEHALLGALLFAALGDQDRQIDLAPLSAETWAAFGLPPRPAFVLELPVRSPLPAQAVPLVRELPVIRFQRSVGLQGRVLGPGDVPLSGASVRVVGLGGSTTTDHQGRFRFARVPGGAEGKTPTEHALEVSAHGARKVVRVRSDEISSGEVTVNFHIGED